MTAMLLLLVILIVTIIKNKQFSPKHERPGSMLLLSIFLGWLRKDLRKDFEERLRKDPRKDFSYKEINFNLISLKNDYLCLYLQLSFINFIEFSCPSIPLYSRALL